MITWKEVVGSNGEYLVSNTGTIMTAKTGRLLKPTIDEYGYERVALFKMHRTKHYRVHRLVAQAFIPNPDNKEQVNHIDGNKRNNNVENLEWVTNAENMRHARENGLRGGHVAFCESRRKPVIATSITTGETLEFESLLATVKYFNTSHVSDVLKGKRGQTKGWTFKFKEAV